MSLKINLLPVKLFSKWQDLSPYLCLCMVKDKTQDEKQKWTAEAKNKNVIKKKMYQEVKRATTTVAAASKNVSKEKIDDENSKNKHLNQQCNNQPATPTKAIHVHSPAHCWGMLDEWHAGRISPSLSTLI